MAKFVRSNINNIATGYCPPYLSWPSDWNRNDSICAVPLKVAKASKEDNMGSRYHWHFRVQTSPMYMSLSEEWGTWVNLSGTKFSSFSALSSSLLCEKKCFLTKAAILKKLFSPSPSPSPLSNKLECYNVCIIKSSWSKWVITYISK